MGFVVRGHSPGQWVARAFAARGGMAALAALVIACSSASHPVEADAGRGTDARSEVDTGQGQSSSSHTQASHSGSHSQADAANDGKRCTAGGDPCDEDTVCCGDSTCMAADGGMACEYPPDCSPAGTPCSASLPCCNGYGNCGEGTTNTCE